MLFKLSLKNIKKSIKDYSIYFFTLVVAVAIFYIFNSMDSQNAMLEMSAYKHQMIAALTTVIGYVSVFVSFILGFLIIYSNNFLIKRRKKEIGLYLTLGMSKRKVSTILVLETLIVGIVSLAVGLGVGILLSQGLSIVIAHMFQANLSAYKFVFSAHALYKSLLYFGVIYFLVMIFNVISLSRYKLIDLLYANRKNESVKFRNKYLMVISFIASIVLIVIAYKKLFGGALIYMKTDDLLIMFITGAAATLLFFFSLSGFALSIIQRIKPLYYKGLNIFNLKQINNKVNSTVISTTIICLMLLFTIGILAGSISLTSAFNGDLRDSNPTDFTIMSNYYMYDDIGMDYKKIDINALAKDKEFNKYVKDYAIYTLYADPKLTYRSLLSDEGYDILYKQYGDALDLNGGAHLMKVSEYNKYAKLIGMDELSLKEDEYVTTMNIDMAKSSFGKSYSDGLTINLHGVTLHPATNETVKVQLSNSTTPSNDGTVIVSDQLINDEIVKADSYYTQTNLVGNYVENKDGEKFEDSFYEYLKTKDIDKTLMRTKIEMQSSSFGIKIMITFICLYLGIIFAISSVTILAIGELSNSSDNKDRYQVIRQLGADEKMINKALFTQIFITFMLPLVVALFHSIFGLKEVIKLIKAVGSIDVTSSIIITTLFMVVVYGGYFLFTYLCSKRIIKN